MLLFNIPFNICFETKQLWIFKFNIKNFFFCFPNYFLWTFKYAITLNMRKPISIILLNKFFFLKCYHNKLFNKLLFNISVNIRFKTSNSYLDTIQLFFHNIFFMNL